MHEQLKGHQLEEQLHLQEEHLRLLGIMNGSQMYTKGTKNPKIDYSDCLKEITPLGKDVLNLFHEN